MKKAVVIPSYNSAHTIEKVVTTLPKVFSERGNGIFLVNDASTDNTIEICQKISSKYKTFCPINHEKNKGYGGALKTGIRYGLDNGFDVFAIVHSDGQYAPEMAEKLMEPILSGFAEIVQGSRMKGGAREGDKPMPLSRYLPNKILTAMENMVFDTDMEEFHSGYMVYSKKLLDKVPFEQLQNNYNFDAEMIVIAKLAGFDCYEVPIPTKYDDETSSLNPIPYGMNVLKMMAKFELGHYRKLLDEHSIKR